MLTISYAIKLVIIYSLELGTCNIKSKHLFSKNFFFLQHPAVLTYLLGIIIRVINRFLFIFLIFQLINKTNCN